MPDPIGEVARLRLADNEVLVVRPRVGRLTSDDAEKLHRACRQLAKRLDVDLERIVILGREVEISVVQADQMSLTP